MTPPMHYQPFYCEENVWHLCQGVPPPCHALFISNAAQQVVLFDQRAAGPEGYVVWDYHVVALAGRGDVWSIHDPDCLRGCPLPLDEWLRASFPHVGRADRRFDPRFRRVDGAAYVRDFASDRRHMRAGDRWRAPPPPWPAIGRGFNLFDYVAMPADDPDVLDLADLRRRFPG